MPYANNNNNNSRKWRWSREDFIDTRSRSRSRSKSGPNLMPPEPLPPWDRKGEFFRDRKNGYGHGYGYENGGGRWRDSPSSPFPSGSRNSSEFSPRWGFSSDFRRPPDHVRQGGWHLYQEDSPHGYSTPRSGDRFVDDDCLRPSGPRGDGRYGRFHRGNRNGFGQKDWRGHSWENHRQYNGPANTPGRPHSMNSQRSVGESPARTSHPNSDPNAQSHSKDEVDRADDANGSRVSEKIGKENSLGSLDWKPLKWSRSGSLTSRGSGFSHSSSSNAAGGESNDVMGDSAPKNATPIRSPSGDVAACDPSAVLREESPSRKKPRLGWGEGLAKYEKKKVDGPEENIIKIENTASAGNVEPTHSVTSPVVDKSPKITGFSDCSSPATPSSFACSSSPGLEKTHGKTGDGDTNNFSVSSVPVSENQPEGMQFSLEKLELNSIANLSSLLSQLLQVDDQCSMDSGCMRSSAFSKLILWKADISKMLELTETEIDSLENELKLLKTDSGLSIFSPINTKYGHSDGITGFTRPLTLEVVASGDMIVENRLPNQCSGGVNVDRKDEEIDSPGTATSKFVEPLCTQKPVSPCELKNSCAADNGLVKSSSTVQENLFTCGNEQITEGTSPHGDVMVINNNGVATVVEHPGVGSKKEDTIHDVIVTSNKNTAAKASEVLIKLLRSDDNDNDMETVRVPCLPVNTTINEKFLRRKRLLKFKERALSLKYRAFHHLWKEDLRSVSLTSHLTKSQKKLDLISRAIQIGNQKHRPSIRSRYASPAGSSSLVPTTEILDFTRKMLSDSEMKIYRSGLKMPAMILDEKEKASSRFVSSNGLVEDPCEVEKERALINPWTTEEKETFMEKLSTFGKDFRKIASFLDHKTIADCVQFYYKNHKSECFEKTKKLDVTKQAKPLSSDTYMLTTGKKWGRDVNSASLDVLGEASIIAAQADQAMKTSKPHSGKLSNRKPRRLDGFIEDERETVAADVLAGICGSLSSEPMGSCVTSSVDHTDGNHEWKRQKLGSYVKRPLTPDVTQNVDDDDDENTCSDESCGEMDPVDWTDDEKCLFVRAFSSHGKDFLMISCFVRTKTRDQCKVFFSKARKCLGLEILYPGSNDTNGGGSDVEDGCAVETGSVGCSDKSSSRMDEDLPHVSLDVSNPDSTVADLSTSDENCCSVQLDRKDSDLEPEVLCSGDNVQDNKSVESGDDIERRDHLITRDDTSKACAAVDSTSGVSCLASITGIDGTTSDNKDPLVSNAIVNYTGSQDGQCKQSTHCISSNQGESEDLRDLPSELSIKAETNGDINHNKPVSDSKVQSFQECYFRKCSRSACQNAVAELPLLKSEGQTNDHAMFTSSDTEKPCSSGDVKLFGKILSKTSSADKATSSIRQFDDTANNHPTPGTKLDHNGLMALENVPVRNYGIWDGSKIKVVSYPLPTNSSSALLLAKYPAAFANGAEHQTLQVPVNSGECNLNNACSFSPREYNNGNLGVVDYPIFRNQDGVSPLTLDFKQRQNVLPCTGISDPVAALRSHYSNGGGGGQTVNGVVREESYGGDGDIER